MSERVVRVRASEAPTKEQEQRIKALAASDAPIDYSDIAPLDESFWSKAVRNPFYRPTKSQLTVRVDNDVLNWLKAKGKGYQTRINAILRQAMLDDVAAE